jgi:hypothetical protein
MAPGKSLIENEPYPLVKKSLFSPMDPTPLDFKFEEHGAVV